MQVSWHVRVAIVVALLSVSASAQAWEIKGKVVKFGTDEGMGQVVVEWSPEGRETDKRSTKTSSSGSYSFSVDNTVPWIRVRYDNGDADVAPAGRPHVLMDVRTKDLDSIGLARRDTSNSSEKAIAADQTADYRAAGGSSSRYEPMRKKLVDDAARLGGEAQVRLMRALERMSK